MAVSREPVGLARILSRLRDADLAAKLGSEVTAADLATLLMAVAAERAYRVAASEVLSRYRSDRFSRPGTAPFLRLRKVEDVFIQAVPNAWQWISVSPLVPFGTHHVLGDITQDWVVSTVRPNEVAADATDGLALEAATRRRSTSVRRASDPQRLVALQRVTRAQRYSEEDAFAHFTMFALVTAGRSKRHEGFDPEVLVEHLLVHVDALSRMVDRIEVVLSPTDNAPGRNLADRVRRSLNHRQVQVTLADRRLAQQRYYTRACFKINVTLGGTSFEVCDGGFTDWTERLLNDRRERLCISAAGLDRLALRLST
jgi:hypothetical protein